MAIPKKIADSTVYPTSEQGKGQVVYRQDLDTLWYYDTTGARWREIGVGDFALEVARGNVTGHSVVNKFGRNDDVDAAEDIWLHGGTWTQTAAASKYSFKSSNASDDAGDTGARTMRVYGLNAWDSAQSTEDITLNGTSEVASALNWVIIHRMQVLTAGSSSANTGYITATAWEDDGIKASIGTNDGQTLMAIYGVPSTQKLFVSDYYYDIGASAGAAASAGVELQVRENADQTDSCFVVKHHTATSTTGTSALRHEFNPYFTVDGPAVVKLRVTEVSSGNKDMSGGFDGYLVND